MVELTEQEVRFLWQKKYRAQMPANLSLQKAAEAVLLEYGAEQIELELRKACESSQR